jgi:hypothetical protein
MHLLCAFAGLNNFPYDTLRCPIDLGGWLISPAQQGMALMDDGSSASAARTHATITRLNIMPPSATRTHARPSRASI